MVAIKDMEMPECCAKCRVKRDCEPADEWDEFDWNYDERCDGCPLVEIITCKDCKHDGTMRCKCFMSDGHEYMSYRNPNFYCADAERREP